MRHPRNCDCRSCQLESDAIRFNLTKTKRNKTKVLIEYQAKLDNANKSSKINLRTILSPVELERESEALLEEALSKVK